jgi:hypothetical protein
MGLICDLPITIQHRMQLLPDLPFGKRPLARCHLAVGQIARMRVNVAAHLQFADVPGRGDPVNAAEPACPELVRIGAEAGVRILFEEALARAQVVLSHLPGFVNRRGGVQRFVAAFLVFDNQYRVAEVCAGSNLNREAGRGRFVAFAFSVVHVSPFITRRPAPIK